MGLILFSCGGQVQENAVDEESVYHILSENGKTLRIKESGAGEMVSS